MPFKMKIKKILFEYNEDWRLIPSNILNAFKYRRKHKIRNGNAIKLILIGFAKKENLRWVSSKFSDKSKRSIIISENKINLKLALRLNLSS